MRVEILAKLIMIIFLLFVSSRISADDSLCLVTPKVTGASGKIFNEMIQGIQASAKIYDQLNTTSTASEQEAFKSQCEKKSIVTLGKGGLSLAHDLQLANITAGSVKYQFSNQYMPSKVLLYEVDPSRYVKFIETVLPNIKTVHIVLPGAIVGYPVAFSWKDLSSNSDIEFKIYHEENFKQSAKRYKKLIKTMDPTTEAIWIRDRGKKFAPILNWILEMSWDRGIVTIASSVNQVKRGALFTLFPDNRPYGEELATYAFQKPDGDQADLSFSNHYRLAINHIAFKRIVGPEFDTDSLKPDIVFPISN